MRASHGFQRVSSEHPLAPAVNEALSGDRYYISYNPSVSGYGCQTTAIVLYWPDSHRVFLVLNGDHREGLALARLEGLAAVVRYFIAHLDSVNEFSEHRQAAGLVNSDPFDLKQTARARLGLSLYRAFASAVGE